MHKMSTYRAVKTNFTALLYFFVGKTLFTRIFQRSCH